MYYSYDSCCFLMRDRKDVDLDRKGDREKLGGINGEGIVT